MKIFIIGRTGQLGGDILKNGKKHDIYAPGRDMVDITSSKTLESAFYACRPDIVINTAAFHNVPLCEQEYEKAFLINCIAVRNIAMMCKQYGSLFVTFSSDYVFDGKKRIPYCEGDRISPLQVYGISRAAGEFAAIATAEEKTIIIRTCGLYGISGAKSKGGNFVDKRIEEANKQRVIEMSCDQTVSPTYTDDLSKAILLLVEHPNVKPGIYHLVNEGGCTWYEFTKAIFEIMGFKNEVKPVDRGGMTGTMKRPLYSVLSNTKAKFLGIVLPCWRDALVRYLKAKFGI
jgi:dTDP-4-dehydrorhamnose reductase